jgi:uncharacterized protein (DUF2147 family)
VRTCGRPSLSYYIFRHSDVLDLSVAILISRGWASGENVKTAVKTIALLGSVLFGLVAPAQAQDLSPAGTWKSATGESRYNVSYCGDGTQLCAVLTWLRDDAQTDENLKLLNGYVMQGATMTGENQWKGKVRFGGQSANGKLIMNSANSMVLSGCKMGICKTFEFVRA